VRSKHSKIINDCYPIVFEYKTLVYTKRNELERHDIEKESISDCFLYFPDFPQLVNIKEDLPNWR